jgi:hypothetical protein
VTNGTCPQIITRTWTATDACTNTVSRDQIITKCCRPSLITDTLRCTLLPTSCNTSNGIRLIYTQGDSCYKLNASNPGQFYYNAFATGSPGSNITFTVTLPYPFVTQGANPIEVYDSVGTTVNTSNGQQCLIPGNKTYAGSRQVVLTNYTSQVVGSTYTFDVTVTVPNTGFVFLAIHLDYGLKGISGFNKGGAGNDAVSCTNSATVLVKDLATYYFSVNGVVNDTNSTMSCNTFKKSPGTLLTAVKSTSLNPVPNCNGVLKDSKGVTLGTGVTDADGCCMINYKMTGKAATFTVTLTPPGGQGQTKTVTLKANGFIQSDFICP